MGRFFYYMDRPDMTQLSDTKKLLSILANQSNGVVPAWMAKDADCKADAGDISRAELIIKTLKKNEMHPALSKLVNAAENEIKNIATTTQKKSTGVRL
jgi:hypothetical protein